MAALIAITHHKSRSIRFRASITPPPRFSAPPKASNATSAQDRRKKIRKMQSYNASINTSLDTIKPAKRAYSTTSSHGKQEIYLSSKLSPVPSTSTTTTRTARANIFLGDDQDTTENAKACLGLKSWLRNLFRPTKATKNEPLEHPALDVELKTMTGSRCPRCQKRHPVDADPVLRRRFPCRG